MSENGIQSALADSVREVLERMFFIDLPGPAGGEAPVEGVAAQLAFDGNSPGWFRLDMDVSAARTAAAGFLGEDPAELTMEQIEQVVCELSNMICGSVLSRVDGSVLFRLAKPEIASGAASPPAGEEAAFTANLGDGAVRAAIRMERPVCPEADARAF